MTVPAEWVVTPHRATQIEYDPPRHELQRPTWYHKRRAAQIERPLPEGFIQDLDVTTLGGEAWMLSPFKGTQVQALAEDFVGGWIGAEDVTLPTGVDAFYRFKRPDDLNNANVLARVVSQGAPAFRKAWTPGQDLSTLRLEEDIAARQSPEAGDFSPLDRILSSKKTFAPNAGFLVRSARPAFSESARGALFTFYFGGRTDTEPLGTSGGEYAVVMTGDGRLRLWEFEGAIWKKRWEQDALNKDIPPNQLQLVAVPYGRDRIYLSAGGFDIASFNLFIGDLRLTLSTNVLRATYREDPRAVGHTHLKSMTGRGVIRVDQARAVRQWFSILQLLYPLTGRKVDKPFVLPWPKVSAGDSIRLKIDWTGPAGTNVAGQVYNSATHLPLSQDAEGNWLAVENQRSYYVVATLTTTDPQQTPFFEGYQIEAPGYAVLTSPPGTVVSAVERISISGPDLTPDLETASYQVRDINSDHEPLATRGTVPIRISTTNNADGDLTVLFQGDTVDHGPVQRGPTPQDAAAQWPALDWKSYNVDALGEWMRIAEQRHISFQNFAEDETATPDPKTGVRAPWKITRIITYVLSDLCGYPPEMLDIPDLDLRLWSNGDAKQQLTLGPAADLAEFLMHMVRDYLGGVLFFDANAGDYGMWRLLQYPEEPFTNLMEFVFEPENPNTFPHAPESYGDGKTFVLRDSHRPKRRPPEATAVSVYGVAGDEKGPDGKYKLNKMLVNPKGHSFPGFPPATDRTHPDFLGRFVPIVHYDTLLTTPAAVKFVCRRIFDVAAHGQDVVLFVAPLVLVTDPNDPHQRQPRPLRIYDPVIYNGRQALIRSCSPDYEHDWQQWARYEVLLAPEDEEEPEEN